MANQNRPETQQFVEIKDIQDGIAVLKNGGLRRIIMVDGINFDLKSEEEQNLVTFSYQNFLNSLDFSIQILVHSRKLNIDDYITKLEEKRNNETNTLLKTQIGEYLEFVRSFVETNAVMTKSFFIVIPYDPVNVPGGGSANIIDSFLGKKQSVKTEDRTIPQSHREQLNQRTGEVTSGLRQAGLRAIPLEDPELIELFYNYYNPSTIEKRGGEISQAGIINGRFEDIVAPSSITVNPNHLKIGDKFAKTLFVFNYPRYLSSGWFSPIINFPNLLDISIFVHPVDTSLALRKLRRKAAEIEAQLIESEEKGLVRDPLLETAYQDVESLRDSLQQSQEKLFDVSIYLTIYADTEHELKKLEGEIVNILDSKLVNVKPANFEQMNGFTSTMPICKDMLDIHSPLNSGPVSSFFPFVSLNLTSDDGIMYGVNRHNNTLVIFDRFSLENANMVIFAKAGSGKSYATKLEIIRSLMTGTDIIVIDPENEYLSMAKAVGGSIFKISLNSESHINPFDIPIIPEGEEPGEVLKSHIVTLAGLIKLMIGEISPSEEAILDRALIETYAARDITPGKDFSKATPPLLEDLETVLRGMEGGAILADKLYRFTKGSYAGFANKPTNVNVGNRLIVFSIRDLEADLRPVAMYIVLNFVWNLIRSKLKKRMLIIDEAWWMMKYPDSASFLFGLSKRCRKYYLGITTITQDVEDFLSAQYGRPIITNSSLQLLLKQSPAAIDAVGKALNLTEIEKNYLLETGIGQGLFIAGLKRAAIQIVPSYFEDKLITTNPEELLKQRNENG
jgi:type IV secretory pathway VirB4 component